MESHIKKCSWVDLVSISLNIYWMCLIDSLKTLIRTPREIRDANWFICANNSYSLSDYWSISQEWLFCKKMNQNCTVSSTVRKNRHSNFQLGKIGSSCAKTSLRRVQELIQNQAIRQNSKPEIRIEYTDILVKIHAILWQPCMFGRHRKVDPDQMKRAVK
jgi:hypothetical protein